VIAKGKELQQEIHDDLDQDKENAVDKNRVILAETDNDKEEAQADKY